MRLYGDMKQILYMKVFPWSEAARIRRHPQTLWEHGTSKAGPAGTAGLFCNQQGPSQHAQHSSPNSSRGLRGVNNVSGVKLSAALAGVPAQGMLPHAVPHLEYLWHAEKFEGRVGEPAAGGSGCSAQLPSPSTSPCPA